MVAARYSNTKGQLCSLAYLSEKKYESLRGTCKNWDDKFKAILIFKVVSDLIYDRDIIIIHIDFHGKTREHVVYHLKKLFREAYPERFPNKPLKEIPEILFSSTGESTEVKEADVKSSRLRLGTIPEKTLAYIKDPSFDDEISFL
jgi:hypothetical protein